MKRNIENSSIFYFERRLHEHRSKMQTLHEMHVDTFLLLLVSVWSPLCIFIVDVISTNSLQPNKSNGWVVAPVLGYSLFCYSALNAKPQKSLFLFPFVMSSIFQHLHMSASTFKIKRRETTNEERMNSFNMTQFFFYLNVLLVEHFQYFLKW